MGTINAGLFSSAEDDWATPVGRFREWAAEFGPFDVDVCASAFNAKVARFYDERADGLAQDWRGTCWMNPPYGRGIGAWIEKARQSAEENGATVVCLLPARTDTKWWQDNIEDEIQGRNPAVRVVRFVRGRLKFSAKGPAPFPSALVVFGPCIDLEAGPHE